MVAVSAVAHAVPRVVAGTVAVVTAEAVTVACADTVAAVAVLVVPRSSTSSSISGNYIEALSL